MFIHEDKVAFITGGLGIIGKTYTKYLLQQNIKGVALVDLNKPDPAYQQELATKYGPNKCIFIEIDVTNKHDLRDAFETTVKHFAQLDIVINNAGICNEADYELTLTVNFMSVVHGTMMAMREYLPKYKKGPGMIINTSSVAGVFVDPFIPVYGLSKHAIIAIGLNYANHPSCVEQNIKILTICPSPTTSNVMSQAASYHGVGTASLNGKPFPISEKADYLGEGLIKIINEGVNGAVWIFKEGNEPHIVDYQPHQKLATEYLFD